MNRNYSSGSRFVMTVLALGLLVATHAAAGVVDFEDLTPSTSYSGPGGGQFWNGSDAKGSFVSQGVTFANSYSQSGGFESWDGWSYSNTSDTVTAGFTNQFSAYTGVDHTADPGRNYGVYGQSWSSSPTITLAPNTVVHGAWITNTTYAALSMRDGDSFAKKFGGNSGTDPDWFKLSITGGDKTVDFYLADYRSADSSLDYLVDRWTWVDLTALGDATQLSFGLSSSDNGAWGMNTPAYFALDDLVFSEVPEPGTGVMLGTGVLLGSAFLWRRTRAGSAARR